MRLIAHYTIPDEPPQATEVHKVGGWFELFLTPGTYDVMGKVGPSGLVEDLWVTCVVDARVSRVIIQSSLRHRRVGEDTPLGKAWRASELANAILRGEPPGLELVPGFAVVTLGDEGRVPDAQGVDQPYRPAGIRGPAPRKEDPS